MIVVSPWSKGGCVTSELLDHTSIIRFIEQRFGVKEPNISPWRRAVCGDLLSAFDFTAADDRLPALPSTAAYFPPDRNRHPDVVPVPPTAQNVPEQERGVRRARPLPYDLDVAISLEPGGVSLEFINRGQAGAVFHTRSRAIGSPAGMIAQMFTVDKGRRHRTVFAPAPSTGYDVEIHGPNGFYRQAAGSGAVAPEVATAPGGSGESLTILLSNAGGPVELTFTDHYHDRPPTTRRVRPGGRTSHTVGADVHGWYDVTIASSADSRFIRRLAGHVESGRPSTSDPALGG
jgi:phospholipase C